MQCGRISFCTEIDAHRSERVVAKVDGLSQIPCDFNLVCCFAPGWRRVDDFWSFETLRFEVFFLDFGEVIRKTCCSSRYLSDGGPFRSSSKPLDLSEGLDWLSMSR